jgi:hypothetical protein
MTPKFTLGIALGFTASVIWKNRPYRDALRGRLRPEVPKLIQDRIAAVEARLEQADRVILQQSRAAAKAYRPAKPPDSGPLSRLFVTIGSDLEAFRQEVKALPELFERGSAELRGQLDPWIESLPALVTKQIHEEPSGETAFPQVNLDLPKAAAEEPAPAAPHPALWARLAERLAAQNRAVDEVAQQAIAIRARLER